MGSMGEGSGSTRTKTLGNIDLSFYQYRQYQPEVLHLAIDFTFENSTSETKGTIYMMGLWHEDHKTGIKLFLDSEKSQGELTSFLAANTVEGPSAYLSPTPIDFLSMATSIRCSNTSVCVTGDLYRILQSRILNLTLIV